jgi:predicted ABC-type ATPase
MAQRNTTLLASNKADLQLAISSINSDQIQSNRSAAAIYSVSEQTIRRRRASISARRDCQPNLKKPTQLEEEVIISYILNLDQRGFAPLYAAIHSIANKLLAIRGAGQVRQK